MSDALHPPPIELNGCRRIGVLADTHIPHRLKEMPPQVYELLRGSDVILHAGDLETPDILPPLQAIAPTYAVRGNLHWQFSTGLHDQDLPLCVTLRAGRHVIWMTHGHISFAYSVLDKLGGIRRRAMGDINQALIARLARLKPHEATIVIFGHSHVSCAKRMNGALYFNPGAIYALADARPRESARIGCLTLHSDGSIDYDWKLLEM